MRALYLFPFIIAAGMLQAFGNSMNAQLNASLRNPWLASLVSFALIVAVFVILFAVQARPLPSSQDIEAMPWWAPIGGLAGALAVFAGLTMVAKIGAGPFNGMIITANLIASLLIDHFGWLNMPIHQINAGRIIGAFLMIAGIILIQKF